MKFSFILALLLPFYCFPQQPAKPVTINSTNTLNIDLLNVDLPMITDMIKKTNDQIKALKDELIVLRNQQTAIAGERQRKQFEITQLETKTNRSQQETAKLQQLKNEIKNIELKIEQMNEEINEISDSISRLEFDLGLMAEKLKELDSKEKNQQKKDAQNIDNLKNDPVRLYARVKSIYDSLPNPERAKLNATENKTLNYFNNLYNSNANFKAAVSRESKVNVLTANTENAKDSFALVKTNHSEMLSKLKAYLQMLASFEGKTQF